jgi:anti-sigma regulatory factor (Ser/Thr protein kinase)/predicted DNA-binding transcriptional regulator AlpA
MNIKKLILKILAQKKEIRTADIVEKTGFSRGYISRFLKELQEEGKIILIGKANQARYVEASKKAFKEAKRRILKIHRVLANTGLSEDVVLDNIKKESGIFIGLPGNVSSILDYAFSEMLNNAIDHSQSEKIEIEIKRDSNGVFFSVIDKGVGIFNNITRKKRLNNEMEAIQDLLKGKQTTAPEAHTGEGIFFTSRASDTLVIQSSRKKLIFNNVLGDVFIQDVKNRIGTKVTFAISVKSKKKLSDIFKEYTDDSYEFSKTVVAVKLYKMGDIYISRSQARRIMSGLDKFKTVVLDFDRVKTVGQGFADEVFRVWQKHHLNIKIIPKNTNENINFMIKRVLSGM